MVSAVCKFLTVAVAVGVAAMVLPVLLDTRTDGAVVVGRRTMRAVQNSAFGDPADVLELVDDAPVPSFGSGEVLVEVHAAALNPVDHKLIEGNFYVIAPLLTFRPGFDFSGRVVAVGAKCTRLKVGDLVHGMTSVMGTGSLAEFLAVPESYATFIPAHLTFAQAAALPLVALTSYNSVAPYTHTGSRVLVLGGGSATGMAALQVARLQGAAHIATTCSPRSESLVRSLGAHEVVNYREHDVWELMASRGKQFDVIYDTIGGSTGPGGSGGAVWKGAAERGVLAHGGNLVTITGDVQSVFHPSVLIERVGLSVYRKLFAFFQLGGAHYRAYTQMSGEAAKLDLLNAGKVVVPLDEEHYQHEFTLESVRRAFARQMSGQAHGKVVVAVVAGAGDPR
jgi:NADPH:quinone reductase-like Zn-dependent oxidoreductase